MHFLDRMLLCIRQTAPVCTRRLHGHARHCSYAASFVVSRTSSSSDLEHASAPTELASQAAQHRARAHLSEGHAQGVGHEEQGQQGAAHIEGGGEPELVPVVQVIEPHRGCTRHEASVARTSLPGHTTASRLPAAKYALSNRHCRRTNRHGAVRAETGLGSSKSGEGSPQRAPSLATPAEKPWAVVRTSVGYSSPAHTCLGQHALLRG